MGIEILAPAGGYDAAVAAIRTGANAVYLGSKYLNARRNAQNFDDETLSQITAYAHEHSAKVYLTLNIMVLENEKELAKQAVKTACRAGVDALIVQDLAVVKIVKECAPQMRLHASTQMSVHNISGVKQLEKLGFARVVLSRELSKDEIARIAAQTDMELEVFVHGALCMCVSGQCYMSSVIGERSGNRGLCAQPCRLPFYVKDKGRYNLSLKDLSIVSHIKELEKIGVTSVKIEGRMKRPEYTAAAVTACREAAGGKNPDTRLLRAVFSRSGFTDGYYTSHLGRDMFGTRQKEDVTAADSKVLKELASLYRKENPLIALKASFTAKKDEPIVFELSDDMGNTVTTEGEVPQIAINVPTTAEKAYKNLSKTGDTPYHISEESFTADIEDGLMIPAGALNAVRRDALEELSYLRMKKTPPKFTDCPENLLEDKPYKGSTRSPALRVRFDNLNQMQYCDLSKVQRIILPIQELLRIENLSSHPLVSKFAAQIDRAVFDGEDEIVKKLRILKKQGVNYAVCPNIGAVTMAQNAGMTPCGDFGLNIANSIAASAYAQLGLSDITLSFEPPLAKLNAVNSPVPKGILAYGHLPLMLTRNCPVKNEIGCKQCGRKSGITDRKGIFFPVRCTRQASEVLNSKPLYLADRLNELYEFDFITLYFTVESSSDAAKILKEYISGGKRDDITRGLYYRNLM